MLLFACEIEQEIESVSNYEQGREILFCRNLYLGKPKEPVEVSEYGNKARRKQQIKRRNSQRKKKK